MASSPCRHSWRRYDSGVWSAGTGKCGSLDLEVEVSRTEDLPVLTGSLLGRGQIAAQDALGDLALQAARQGDEPAAVARQRVLVDARLVVEPLQVREGGELDEVAVALKIRRQQDEMKGVGVEFWIAV